MLISKFLAKTKLSDTIIKSIIYNTIIEIFKSEKNINLKNYIVSINIKWKTILVKTTKPMINNELLILNEKIKSKIDDKFNRINIDFNNFEIKYK
jgi:hypothetical protein